ncbi:MAG: restriction endonuclease subunit S [Microscillaceae bacterium]|jgi:type I restriction enzyme S subunit|nr:restriction endonuclease subunit S [Microscillaceae bacterium]
MWKKIKLKDILIYYIGGDWGIDANSNDSNYIKCRIIRATDYNNWRKERAYDTSIRKIKKESFDKRQLREGDIIIEISGGSPAQPVGRTLLIDNEAINSVNEPIVCSNFFRLMRIPKSVICPDFVNFYLRFLYLNGVTENYQKNTTNLRNLQFTDFINQIEIPIPSLKEQIKIANKLNAFNEILANAKEKIQKIPKLIERYRQAVLEEAVTGKLTEEWRNDNLVSIDDWKVYRLQDICISIADGDHQSPKKLKLGIPFIVISNIQNGKINFGNTMFVSEEYFKNLKEQRVPKKSDILFSIVGSIGLVALIDEEKEFCFQRHIALLKPNHNFIFNKYLYYFLSSNTLLNQALSKAKGVAQLTLNIRDLRNIELKTPSLIEQKEVTGQAEKLLSKADKAEAEYKKAISFIDKLEQSVLQMAFSGQLSEAIIDDEPIEKLLERIAEEKKTIETQKNLQRKLHQAKTRNQPKNRKMKAEELRKVIQNTFPEKSFSFEQLNALLSFEDYDDFKEEFFKIAEEPVGNEKNEQFLEVIFNEKNPKLLFQIKKPSA